MASPTTVLEERPTDDDLVSILKDRPEMDYFQNGLRLKDMGQTNQAANHFKKALQHNTNFFPAIMELALIYEEGYQLTKAEKLYRRCLDIYQENYDLLIHFASCLLRQRKVLEAFKYLRQAEHLEPDLPTALYFKYCAYFYDAHKPKQALHALRILLQAHPDFTPIYLTIAEIHQAEGRRWLSLVWYRRALRQNPKSKDALLALSAIYGNDFRDRDKAIFYCHQLLELDPEDSHARANLAIAMNIPYTPERSSQVKGLHNLQTVSPMELQDASRVIHCIFGQ